MREDDPFLEFLSEMPGQTVARDDLSTTIRARGDSLLEFLPEAQGDVHERDAVSSTWVHTLLHIDLEGLRLASERGTETIKHRHAIRASLALSVAAASVGFAVFLPAPPAPGVATLASETSSAQPARDPDGPPSVPMTVRPAPIPVPATRPAIPQTATLVESMGATTSKPEVRLPRQTASAPLPVSTRSGVSPAEPMGERAGSRESDQGQANGPFRGSLLVRSSPEGARVFINGVLVGVTPLLLPDLPVGSRAVRVELEGYERWSSGVRIVAAERTVTAAELRPSPIP